MSEKNKNKKDVENYNVGSYEPGSKANSDRANASYYYGVTKRPAIRTSGTWKAKDGSTTRMTSGDPDFRKKMLKNKSDEAYTKSYIAKGRKASDEARANALQMMKSKKPSYTTPGGLVYDELKKQLKSN
jgi:hypothetical protein